MRRSSTSPRVIRVVEWKWNHIARPDVINRAATAPVRGQGLGSTIWYACACCAIKYFLVGRGLIGVQRRKLGLWLRRFQGWSVEQELLL